MKEGEGTAVRIAREAALFAVIKYLQLHARWSGDDAAAAVDNDGTWRSGVSHADGSQHFHLRILREQARALVEERAHQS